MHFFKRRTCRINIQNKIIVIANKFFVTLLLFVQFLKSAEIELLCFKIASLKSLSEDFLGER